MLIAPYRTLAASLVLAAALSGCLPAPEGPRDEQKNPFYLAGKERLQALDYAGAVESFERALEENPRSALAHYELGVIYDQHQADYAAALYHYNKALKLRPSTYPADNIRQRIPACRQELVKADSLAVLNPSALRETERLREENQQLKQQILVMQTALAGARAGASGSATPVPPATGGARPSPSPTSPVSPQPSAAGSPPPPATSTGLAPAPGRTTPSDSASRPRYHTLRQGETLASVSRTYNIRLNALLSANPGLDPRKLKAGQTVKIPAP